MAHVQLPAFHQRADRFRQFQQTQQVRHASARTANRLSGLFVRHVELEDEPLQRAGLFQGVQVFALNVLDERHRHRSAVRHLANENRHLREARQLRSAPAAFTRNDFVAGRFAAGHSHRPHHDGLHQALRLDAFGQFLQRVFAHVRTGLVLPALHGTHRQVGEFFAKRRRDGTRGHRTRRGGWRCHGSCGRWGLLGACLCTGRHLLGRGAAEQRFQTAAETAFLHCH